MPVTLLIARHGNTFAPGDIIRRIGLSDLPLVDSGVQQGYSLGNYLKKTQRIPDRIFTSNLQRTTQTALAAQEAMQTQLPVQALSMFNEIDYGPDENQPEQDVVARIGSAALAAWDFNGQVPNGWRVNPNDIIQNWHSFADRLQSEYPNQTILVITSNGIARFAPYLTGDFTAFAALHGIKLATGAVSIFQPSVISSHWDCLHWNIRPSVIG